MSELDFHTELLTAAFEAQITELLRVFVPMIDEMELSLSEMAILLRIIEKAIDPYSFNANRWRKEQMVAR